MFCLEGRLFLRAQGYSLISLMVNPALIVPLCNMADITVKLSILWDVDVEVASHYGTLPKIINSIGLNGKSYNLNLSVKIKI